MVRRRNAIKPEVFCAHRNNRGLREKSRYCVRMVVVLVVSLWIVAVAVIGAFVRGGTARSRD
jgi:nitrate reductase NapE component